MPAYLGTGYLLNIARSGAHGAPARPQMTPVLGPSEPGMHPASEPLEIETEANPISAATDSPINLAVTASSITNLVPPLNVVPEAVNRESDHDTSRDTSHAGSVIPPESGVALSGIETAGATALPATPRAPEPPAPIENLRPSEMLEKTAIQPVNPLEQRAAEPASQPRVVRSAYRIAEVFELRMPENFFGHQSGSHPTGPAQPEVTPEAMSAPLIRPHTSSPPLVTIPQPRLSDNAQTSHSAPNESKDRTTVIPVRDAAEPQPASPPPQPASQPSQQSRAPRPAQLEPQPVKQMATVVSDFSSAAPWPGEPPARLAPSASLDTGAPRPRQEQPTSLTLRPPAPAEAAAPPQPRLRINRLDVQIINQPAPQQQPAGTSAPDVTQQLERRYLGRADLIV